MIIVRCHKPPKEGGQKRKTAIFRAKSHFAWRKSATKLLCVKTVTDRPTRLYLYRLFVSQILSYYVYANAFCHWLNKRILIDWLTDWHLLDYRSCKNDSWEKSLSRENLADTDPPACKSPIFHLFQLRFSMSPRWTWVAQKRKVSKIWTISCDDSETVRTRMSGSINQW